MLRSIRVVALEATGELNLPLPQRPQAPVACSPRGIPRQDLRFRTSGGRSGRASGRRASEEEAHACPAAQLPEDPRHVQSCPLGVGAVAAIAAVAAVAVLGARGSR